MKKVYWSFTLGDTLDQTLPTDYTDPQRNLQKIMIKDTNMQCVLHGKNMVKTHG